MVCVHTDTAADTETTPPPGWRTIGYDKEFLEEPLQRLKNKDGEECDGSEGNTYQTSHFILPSNLRSRYYVFSKLLLPSFHRPPPQKKVGGERSDKSFKVTQSKGQIGNQQVEFQKLSLVTT